MSDILAHFKGVKVSGNGWIASCTAHEDRKASLSISRGDDGRWLLHCHAGCALDDVLSAVHLERRDLFPQNGNGNGTRQIVATYDYSTTTSELLFQVVRYEPKDFRQRRPDGSGGWIHNCYLAAGRPVIAQDTGFSRFLPTGRGLFAFETEDDVLAAIEELSRDYPGHCRAAREIAEQSFDSDKVLGRLLEAPLRHGSRVRRGIDARETRDPGAERAVAFSLDNDGVVLRHSPASFRIRWASPVPTSFLVWTYTVMTFLLSGCTN